MSASDSSSIDLINELQLRQWARKNYVSEESRSPDWHPVVLDEMRRRDEEVGEVR
jgi:hypothetical protein